MRRFGRKLDVDRLRAELPLAAFFFDCLQRDGDDLVDRPARERFAALAATAAGGARDPAHRDEPTSPTARRSSPTRSRAATRA